MRFGKLVSVMKIRPLVAYAERVSIQLERICRCLISLVCVKVNDDFISTLLTKK